MPSRFPIFEEIKPLVRLALTVLSANIFGTLMEVCDIAMVSNTGKAKDLLLLTEVSALWFPILFLLQNILLNNLPLLVRFRCAQQHERIRETFWNALFLTAGLSLFSFLFLSYMPHFFLLLRSLGKEPVHALSEEIARYCSILRWGCPAFFAFSTFKALSDGAGKTVVGTKIGLMGLLCNVFSCWTLVYGTCGVPKLGAVGCALSTVLSYWIMSALFVANFFLSRKKYQSLLGKEVFKFQWPQRKILLKQFFQGGINGLAHFIETVAFAAAIVLLQCYKSDTLIDLPSIRLANTVADLLYLLPLSLSIACTIRIGIALGKNAPVEKIYAIKNASLFIGLLIATLNGLLLVLLRTKLAEFCNPCPKIQELTQLLFVYVALYQLPEMVQVIHFGVLRAYQKVFSMFFLNFFAYWIVAIPLGMVLGLSTAFTSLLLGASGFWFALLIGLSCAAFFSFLSVSKLLAKAQAAAQNL